MADYSVAGSSGTTGVSQLTAPAAGDKIPVVDISDTTTAPAGSAGSDKYMTVATSASAFASLAGDKVSAQLFGIDPTGATAIDTIVNGLISGLPAQGGEIFLGEGTFKVSAGLLAELTASQTVTLRGAGAFATILKYYGSGDCVRMYNPTNQTGNYGGNIFSVRSGVRDLTIDGTSASAGASGLHAGDVMNLRLDVVIQNFSGTGSKGLWLDNSVTWTEQADIRASLVNNTSGVVMEVTLGAPSFGYGNYDFSIQAYPGQDGLVIKNGAFPYSSKIRMRGNFGASASFASNAALRVTGVAPGGSDNPGNASQAWATVFDIDVECNVGPSSATAGPYTVYVDSGSGCSVYSCTGQFNFAASGGTWHAANATAGGDFQFFGPVLGDSTISQSTVTWPTVLESAVGIGNYATPQTLTTGATISLTGNLLPLTSAAAVTGVILTAGSGGMDGQLTVLCNTGSYPITFAAPGTSNLAAADVLPAGQAALYTWSAETSLWYRTPQVPFTATLASNVESPTSGTSYANVTGLSAYLGVGTWKIRGYFPVEAVATGALARFAFTFGGTAASANVAWQPHGSAYAAPLASTTLTTAMTTAQGVTTSTTVIYYMECAAAVTVSAAGTLQVQCACSASTDAFNVLAGAFLEATQVG